MPIEIDDPCWLYHWLQVANFSSEFTVYKTNTTCLECDFDPDLIALCSSRVGDGLIGLGNGSVVGTEDNITSFGDIDAQALSWWKLILGMFCMFTVFGNSLVVMSVIREKSLQTATNYYIVSLAIADLCVGALVCPLAVYVEVHNGFWNLGPTLCDVWVAVDVMACTASILNLCAISVDRFLAVTRPIRYARHKNSKRIYVILALCWLVSVGIASPIVFGANYDQNGMRDHRICFFYNSEFIIFSSLGSFYIPCFIMVVLYWRVFVGIRARGRKVKEDKKRHLNVGARDSRQRSLTTRFGASHTAEANDNTAVNSIHHAHNAAEPMLPSGACAASCSGGGGVSASPRKGRCEHIRMADMDESHGSDDENDSEILANTSALDVAVETYTKGRLNPASTSRSLRKKTSQKMEAMEQVKVGPQRSESRRVGMRQPVDSALNTIEEDHTVLQFPRPRAATLDSASGSGLYFTSVNRIKGFVSRIRIKSVKVKSAHEKSYQKKERKATKTLAIVLGAFLFCWVPFFTANNMTAICLRFSLPENRAPCNLPPDWMSLFVWLGYINSFANPMIYTIFNTEFRKAFQKLLRKPCSS